MAPAYYSIRALAIGVCLMTLGISCRQTNESTPDPKNRDLAASHLRIPCLPGANVRALPRKPAEIFVFSDDYPTSALPSYTVENYPWIKYDPKKKDEWQNYLWAVLNYAYNERVDSNWRMERSKSPWYHAPWMQRKYKWDTTKSTLTDLTGYGGREWVHGLTKELSGNEAKIIPTGSTANITETWAVSLYNEPGGNTIGRAWKNLCEGNVRDTVLFPPGTVAIKFLFTTASPEPNRVSYLKGGVTWLANIDSLDPDSLTAMHLLQIDIAVRDTQVDATTGWVFGAFVTMGDSAIGGPWRDTTQIPENLRGWYRVRPLGLIWGNDTAAARDNLVATQDQHIDTSLSNRIRPSLGWKGRFNGPADGGNSSCIGCHQQAQRTTDPRVSFKSASSPFGSKPSDSILRGYFLRNLHPHQAFVDSMVSLDYSLQLQTGVGSFWNFWRYLGK